MEKIEIMGIASALIYAVVGIAVFFLVLSLVEWSTKYSINKKIADEGNVALAIVLGSMIIALGLIISSAIR